MSKVLVVYWSGTGNTEKMAELIEKGASSRGAEVARKSVSDAKVAELADYDVVAFGSPSMGSEVIEEAEMEPFFTEAVPAIKGKKTAIFGSYGWGDGEWMRLWADRARDAGTNLMDDGLIVHETPEGDSETQCVSWGEKLAEF
jgi:flavodoxin short chain